MKIDFKKPYATITGHDSARYEQNGELFKPDGTPLNPRVNPTELAKDKIIPDDGVAAAQVFLRNVLAEGALSKATVFKASQDNNQNWECVRQASVLMGIVKFQFKKNETWKLSNLAVER